MVVCSVPSPAVPHYVHIGIDLPIAVRLTVDAMVDADTLAPVIAAFSQ